MSSSSSSSPSSVGPGGRTCSRTNRSTSPSSNSSARPRRPTGPGHASCGAHAFVTVWRLRPYRSAISLYVNAMVFSCLRSLLLLSPRGPPPRLRCRGDGERLDQASSVDDLVRLTQRSGGLGGVEPLEDHRKVGEPVSLVSSGRCGQDDPGDRDSVGGLSQS